MLFKLVSGLPSVIPKLTPQDKDILIQWENAQDFHRSTSDYQTYLEYVGFNFPQKSSLVAISLGCGDMQEFSSLALYFENRQTQLTYIGIDICNLPNYAKSRIESLSPAIRPHFHQQSATDPVFFETLSRRFDAPQFIDLVVLRNPRPFDNAMWYKVLNETLKPYYTERTVIIVSHYHEVEAECFLGNGLFSTPEIVFPTFRLLRSDFTKAEVFSVATPQKIQTTHTAKVLDSENDSLADHTWLCRIL